MSDIAAARAHIEAAQRELDAALLALDESEPVDGIFVSATDDLAAALEQLAWGGTLRLDVAGRWMLPDYVFTKSVALITDGALPEGRISPDLPLPIIVGHLTLCADVACQGIAFEGPHPDGTILTLGDRNRLDRCRVQGSPQGQHRGIRVDAADLAIVSCRVQNIWKDQDTQAICGWDGCRDLVVRDCALEASGENVLFGGADSSSEDRMPQDIVIEDCQLSKPLAWMMQPATTCKNLFELKAARRVKLLRCTLEYSWADGQDGFGIVLTPRNNDGEAPWSTVEDVVIADCTMSHTGSGVQIMGDDYRFPSGRLTNVEFRGCTFTDINPRAWGGAGRIFQIVRGPQQLRILDCTVTGDHLNSCLTFDDLTLPIDGLILQQTRMPSGEYGIKCPETAMGQPTLELYAPGYVWESMTILADSAGNPIQWPPDTTVVGA